MPSVVLGLEDAVQIARNAWGQSEGLVAEKMKRVKNLLLEELNEAAEWVLNEEPESNAMSNGHVIGCPTCIAEG